MQERSERILRRLLPEQLAEQRRLFVDAPRDRVGRSLLQEPLGGADRGGRLCGQERGMLAREGDEVVVWNDAADEARALCDFRIESLGEVEKIARQTQTRTFGKQEGGGGLGNDREVDERHQELCVRARIDEVAVEQHRGPDADRKAVDCRHDWLGEAMEDVHESEDRALGARRRIRDELIEIEPAGEVASLPVNQHDRDRVISVEALEDATKFLERMRQERVLGRRARELDLTNPVAHLHPKAFGGHQYFLPGCHETVIRSLLGCPPIMGESTLKLVRTSHIVQGIETDATSTVSAGWTARMLEAARWNVFGLESFALRNRVVGGVARAAVFDFREPLRFGDEIEISTWLARIGHTSYDFGHAITRLTDGAVATRARVTVVHIGPDGPAPVGADLASAVVEQPLPARPDWPSAPPTVTWSRRWIVRPSDQDSFRHVNQARYVDYIDDTRQLGALAGEASGLEGALASLSVEYLQETHAGEEVEMTTWVTAPRSRAFALTRVDTGKLHCRGQVEGRA